MARLYDKIQAPPTCAAAPATAVPVATTPMLHQYLAAKAEHPDALLMFRMGDFFELFYDDAKVAAHILSLTLTARDKGLNPVPMAGVPHHALDGYVARLVEQGYSVAICDQVEDPKSAKGLVRREIVRLVTPGTVVDLDALDPGRNNYLAAASVIAASDVDTANDDTIQVALALVDVLTGEVALTSLKATTLLDECRRMGVRELVCVEEELMSMRTWLVVDGVDPGPQVKSSQRAVAPERAEQWLRDLKGHVPKDAVLACQSALSLAIGFAEASQRRKLPHLCRPVAYRREDALMMDEATRQSLELLQTQRHNRREGSVLQLVDRTETSMGSRAICQWLLFPLRHMAPIMARQGVVAALCKNRQGRLDLKAALKGMRDIERLAGRVAIGRATPRDVLALGTSLLRVPACFDAIINLRTDRGTAQELAHEAEALIEPWRNLNLCQPLAEALSQAIVDHAPIAHTMGGVFKTGIDETLDDLIAFADDGHAFVRAYEAKERARTGISSLKVRDNRVFGHFIEISHAHTHKVPQDYVRRQTLVNAERFVTEELKSFEEKFLSAGAKRNVLEAQMFESLLTTIVEALPNIRQIAQQLARADALAALADLADNQRYARPTLIQNERLELEGGRHPVLEALMPKGERFVANDLTLNEEDRQLVLVTGPNMAGKSTLMRQAALSVILAQMGGFVPATRAVVGLVDQIFCRVGASDDLGRGQSTFMVEMVETANLLRRASKHSLVLLDEIGRGTSTFDGLSIAWAVAEYLHDHIGCRTLFATHYHELGALVALRPRIQSVQVTAQQERGKIVFLRQVQEGSADQSYGIEVARLAHVPETVLLRAQTLLAYLNSDEKHQAEAPRPAVRRISRNQLSLFARDDGASSDGATFEAPAHEGSDGHSHSKRSFSQPTRSVLEALTSLNIDGLTPIEALALLDSWQKQLKEKPLPKLTNKAQQDDTSRHRPPSWC